jgi:hypothetical protein
VAGTGKKALMDCAYRASGSEKHFAFGEYRSLFLHAGMMKSCTSIAERSGNWCRLDAAVVSILTSSGDDKRLLRHISYSNYISVVLWYAFAYRGFVRVRLSSNSNRRVCSWWQM